MNKTAEKTPAPPHDLILEGRSKLTVTGVKRVLRCDADSAAMETGKGVLHLTGAELNVTSLDLESGEVRLTGRIDALEYTAERTPGGLSAGRAARGGAAAGAAVLCGVAELWRGAAVVSAGGGRLWRVGGRTCAARAGAGCALCAGASAARGPAAPRAGAAGPKSAFKTCQRTPERKKERKKTKKELAKTTADVV